MKTLITALFLIASTVAHADLLSNSTIFEILNGHYIGEVGEGSDEILTGQPCEITFETVSANERKVTVRMADKVTVRTFRRSDNLLRGAGNYGIGFQIDGFNLYGVISGKSGQLERVITNQSYQTALTCLNLIEQ